MQKTSTTEAEVPLSEIEFGRISRIAKSGWGLDLDRAKIPLIRSRLRGRLNSLNLKDYESYCSIIENGDQVESDHFISALTTNVSHFYREIHHFENFEQKILPRLIEKARNGKSVRIWSAGCSTGQEPYSLAGSIFALEPSNLELDIKILATDVDPIVLEKAKEGKFAQRDCNFPSEEYESRVFPVEKNIKPNSIKSVHEKLKEIITFRRLNLVQPWPISGTFDVIMCRNVAIYFDKTTQNDLWTKFAQALAPNGYLFIGHSERISKPIEFGLEVSGITTYRLRDQISAASGKQEGRSKWV